MKKLILAAFLWLSACSVAPNTETPIMIPPDGPEKAAWIAATKGKVFSGDPDLWGGGAYGTQYFAFDGGGNLHNSDPYSSGLTPPQWFPLHRVLLFKSGTEAVVMFYKSAANAKVISEVYALEIRGDKIYRTQNIQDKAARGFTTYGAWDKKTYSSGKLGEIASLDAAIAYPALTVPDPNS